MATQTVFPHHVMSPITHLHSLLLYRFGSDCRPIVLTVGIFATPSVQDSRGFECMTQGLLSLGSVSTTLSYQYGFILIECLDRLSAYDTQSPNVPQYPAKPKRQDPLSCRLRKVRAFKMHLHVGLPVPNRRCKESTNICEMILMNGTRQPCSAFPIM